MTTRLNGSCLCGEVRYTVADEFQYALICHCSQCRRATGSAFKPFGGIERAKLEVTQGSLRIYGDVMTHDAHCKNCGSLLYSIVEEGTRAHVTYGTLIDPPSLRPQAHICVASKAPWDTICDTLPRHDALPGRKAVSLRRLGLGGAPHRLHQYLPSRSIPPQEAHSPISGAFMNAVPRPRFHVISIIAIAALVFIGFARTFYLRAWFDVPLLTQLLVLHGVMFTSWLALHYTQARLIAAHRVDLHRRFGIGGAVLGYSMFFVGVAAAVQSAALGHQPTDAPPLVFMSIPIGTIVAFAALLTAALVMRRRADWHKRLMLLATIALIIPAAARLSSYFTGRNNPAIGIVLTIALVAWCCIEDRRRIGRIHPAYKIAGTLLILSLPARMLVGYTGPWQHLAQWLVGFAPAMSLN